MLQHARLAHFLALSDLPRAAIHALLVCILRRPQDWSDECQNRELLKATVYDDSHIWKLFDGVA